MSTVGIKFASKVKEWARGTEQTLDAIIKESTRRVARIAADGVPVDTGFAKASMRASTRSMPQSNPRHANKSRSQKELDFGKIEAVIASAKLGQTIYIGWTAAYILPLEYGHSQQAPAGFARLAAAQWPIVVNQVAAKMKRR